MTGSATPVPPAGSSGPVFGVRDSGAACGLSRLVTVIARAAATLVVLLALAPPAGAAGPAATQRLLERQMARAGGGSGAYVVDMATGAELYAARPDVARMPASVEKLYTSATALLRYGADGRLTTTVLAPAVPDATGTIAGDLVLRGGGDPTFDSRAAAALAEKLVNGGLLRVAGRVVGDESAFDAFRGPPSSRYQTSSDVGPLSALAFDHGRTGRRRPYFQSRPARFAAEAFAKALERRGVELAGSARAGHAATGAVPLSEWDSPTLAEIVRSMNVPSDNYIAETLVKALGADFGTAGSTAAGAAVVRTTVARFGIAPQVVDGSGLSRGDRTSPRQVVRLLTAMADTEAGDAFEASLPVAGRTGTLSDRMRRSAARDNCQAKTGTLHDVSALAGYCTTPRGSRVAFAFMMNGVSPGGARVLQDRMAAALARYDGGIALQAGRSG